ncbi:LutC/YkgG family protein [Puniceicoccus vermicola]|uniref:Lactate utilization protein n=1 Tax=Puniceicoccus vermicola TaxID=388746 RepID=A0A7X1B1Q1_9BACT|nr:lactate utilization protein [Puniceicoccus vermicola]MBC2604006.1 lactate utilization protein [Puniceicoccus vermicola]
MTDRERIFTELRSAVAEKETPEPLPDLPLDDFISRPRRGTGDWEDFKRNFEGVNGDYLETGEDLKNLLIREKARVGYCPEDLQEIISPWLPEGVELRSTFDRSLVDEYDFGVTRGTFAIAETGTIALQDQKTPDRLGALAPWTHIAVVEKSNLLPTVVQAIQSLPKDPNVIWVTGPSKTADVEGILIEGVHGPGIQACFPI